MGRRTARTTDGRHGGNGMNSEERRQRVAMTPTTESSGSFASNETNGDVWIAGGNRRPWRTADASRRATRLLRKCWTNCGSGSSVANGTYMRITRSRSRFALTCGWSWTTCGPGATDAITGRRGWRRQRDRGRAGQIPTDPGPIPSRPFLCKSAKLKFH